MLISNCSVSIDDDLTPQGYAIRTGRNGVIGYIMGDQYGEPTVALLAGSRLSFDEIQKIADIVKSRKFYVPERYTGKEKAISANALV